MAILKTQNGKYKGILYKVDSVNVILNHDGEFITVPINEIETAQIRTIKKGYKGMNKADVLIEWLVMAKLKMIIPKISEKEDS
jgi:hypothetical protein